MTDHPYIWYPTSEFIEAANVTRLMTRMEVNTASELQALSIADPELLYRSVCEDLEIEWFQPYDRTLDPALGKPWSQWFVGGQVNVAHNCLDRHVAAGRGKHLAMVWNGEDGSVRRRTYAELKTDVDSMANGLVRLAADHGDRIGFYLPMIPEALVAFLACLKIGAIPVPVFTGFGADAIVQRLSHCDTKILITADGFLRRGRRILMQSTVRQVLTRCPTIKDVIVVERFGDVGSAEEGWHRWDELLSQQSAAVPTHALPAEAKLAILYTSGSTGRAKGCVWTHGGAQLRCAIDFAYYLDCKPSDTVLWVSDMGWMVAPYEFIGVLTVGGTLALIEGAIDWPQPDRLWKIVETQRVNTLGLSPSAVRALASYGDEWVDRHPMPSLRILVSGAEPSEPTSYQWYFRRVGRGRCPIINDSGGTEVGAALLAPLPILPIKVCSVGGPVLGMDLDVVDQRGQSVGPGQIGELVCRNVWPSMTKQLWKDPERYIETYWPAGLDAWYQGDQASVDNDGCWFLHGRSDDTLQIAGKRVGPTEVESVLLRHPDLAEAAVIGMPDPDKGEVIACFVALQTNVAETKTVSDDLAGLVEKSLGKPFRPALIRVVPALPRTRSGKLMRRLIKRICAGSELLGDTSSLGNPECLDEIRRAVCHSPISSTKDDSLQRD